MMERSLQMAVQFVLEQLESLVPGAVRPESRFDKMHRALAKPTSIMPGDREFSIVVEAIRDVRMLEFILEELGHRTDSKFLRALTRCTQDSALPQDDVNRSRGRDAQCELYVAAVCEKAQLAPSFEEPDIQCHVKDRRLGIAAKRLKADSQFEKRFREGTRQIERSGIPGYIAIDITLAFHPANTPIVDVSDKKVTLAFELARSAFVDEYYKRMKVWLRGRDVRGLVLLDHLFIFRSPSHWELSTFTFFVNFSPDNDGRTTEFETFQRAYMRGLSSPANT